MKYFIQSFTSSVSEAPSGAHAHVAIVGAGPRGTSVLERLCASVPEILAPGARLTIHVVDPSPPGGGRVWRTSQSTELLMNTVASQITLFTDDSVVCSGPIRHGPSMYQWAVDAKLGLGPDDYPTRAQYGQYLGWVFSETVSKAPEKVTVKVHSAHAVRLEDGSDGRQTLTLSGGRTLSGLAAVILAQGHLPEITNPVQKHLATYAKQNGLRHFPPSNPADVDLSTISPNEPVLLRGLGLNFFDYMALLTTGRGGRFVRTPRGLCYHPSGKEPRMYASSRRGIPYHARGDNAKGAYGRHMPLVFTEEVIASFRTRADAGDAPDFMSEIWPLVSKEVETVYYDALLKQYGVEESTRLDFQKRYLATEPHSAEEAQVLDEFEIPEVSHWSWDKILRPHSGQNFETADVWRDWLVSYLREDAKQARLGNLDGPLKASLDVLRDLRNELRLIVDHSGLKGVSRRDHLDHWYTPLNAYLSIGPPRKRIEQMIALIEAGVLTVIGPQLKVQEADGAWFASSPEIPESEIRCTTLIEARLPEPDIRQTADELLANLLKSGQCRPHTVDGYETGGLDVTNSPYRIVDAKGLPHARRFAVGVPTEGVHWVTAAGARPGVNSVTLTDTDAIARAAAHVAMTEMDLKMEATKWPTVDITSTSLKGGVVV
ncbi:FAD-NAD(P)-binding-domain-containing protein [Aspergillus avenaceus]|uniref:FAD-NAD(P)-binding-domain-containing protein n=1 Tax=Aspergillus avenaceus TaxID=36643 RepID=A0A5N6TS88_ASPAV|nr:FAD-NAD(P)-binding-domain-containing protein [Aspergillus avenaceus]